MLVFIPKLMIFMNYLVLDQLNTSEKRKTNMPENDKMGKCKDFAWH